MRMGLAFGNDVAVLWAEAGESGSREELCESKIRRLQRGWKTAHSRLQLSAHHSVTVVPLVVTADVVR